MANTSIERAIALALTKLFTDELQSAYPFSDALRLQRIDLAPLQDDPTRVAPYLVHRPAPELAELPNEDLSEIGGSTAWYMPWSATIGTPRAGDKLTALTQIAELAARVKRSVISHHNLNNVTAPGPLRSEDGSKYLDGTNPLTMWLGTKLRPYGGQGEFYGEALMFWIYTYRDTVSFSLD